MKTAIDIDSFAGREGERVRNHRFDRLRHVVGLSPAADRSEAVGNQGVVLGDGFGSQPLQQLSDGLGVGLGLLGLSTIGGVMAWRQRHRPDRN